MYTKYRGVIIYLCIVSLLAAALAFSGCGPAPTPEPTATPAPPTASPTPALPVYSEIVKTYPADAELSCTDAEVSDVTADGQWTFVSGLVCPGKSQLTVEAGGTFTTGEEFFGQTWKSYGARLTLKEAVTIDGKTYQPGAKLTVDKDLNWVEVSSWD